MIRGIGAEDGVGGADLNELSSFAAAFACEGTCDDPPHPDNSAAVTSTGSPNARRAAGIIAPVPEVMTIDASLAWKGPPEGGQPSYPVPSARRY